MYRIEQFLNLYFQNRERKLLLHCCCAPCSCSIIDRLLHAEVRLTIFFYNPNIYPEGEYNRRKHEIVQYAGKRGVAFVDVDYDPDRWLNYVRGHEMEKERGVRCSLCFECRLLKTAAFAAENGFADISSTLGISRRKKLEQVTDAGRRAAACYPGVTYLDYNWRKNGGVARMDEIAKHEQFYRQQYCGCMFSIKPYPK